VLFLHSITNRRLYIYISSIVLIDIYRLQLLFIKINQLQVMVLVPIDIYLNTGLGTEWINRQLATTTTTKTHATRSSTASSQPAAKQKKVSVNQYYFIFFVFY
jgi:hypothetical protein